MLLMLLAAVMGWRFPGLVARPVPWIVMTEGRMS
jgi:hypothetical protein